MDDMEILILVCCLILGVIAVVGLYVYELGKRCPHCGKFRALVLKKREVISKRKTTIDVQQQIRNSWGGKAGTVNQAVPATNYVYNETYVCKHCNKKTVKQTSETYRD